MPACNCFAALIGFCLLLSVQAGSGFALAASVCDDGGQAHLWSAPLNPRQGEPLQLMAVATDGELTDLVATDQAGRRSVLAAVKGGGPPWSLRASVPVPAGGSYRVEARRGNRVVACRDLQMNDTTGSRGSGRWDLATQAFFAAWVEHLFDAPPDQALSFASLEPVLRDPQRNFLHDYLSKGEDLRITAEPDCADLAYFLRGYFAWKLGLPVSYRACNRGSATSPPRCDSAEIDRSFVGTKASADTFRRVSRRILDRVTSGGGRTALDSSATDFYPVPLERGALWPGTIYADPYGHTLIVVKWVPQSEKTGGLLLAVDAQPDNSVARKRFWEGTFLFAQTPSAGPGFKAYRAPLAGSGKSRELPANSALSASSGLPPYSGEQLTLTPEAFYARMEKLINPHGLAPDAAYAATLAALMEQLETRVKSVENGEQYMRAHAGSVVAMPKGSAIFETVGPWEDYSTPSRDMRLLIALKVLADLPERIRRHPELFLLKWWNSPEAAAEQIEKLHAQSLREQFITYTRSDGSPWKLSLADIYARRPALEVAYNPNDCIEKRWGAAPGTADYATCRRQAPAEQQRRMEEYRPWFHEGRRPAR